MTGSDHEASWSLSDERFHKDVATLSGTLGKSMADIGDTVMVSLDDMVASNVRPGVQPKSADAVYISNRHIVFVEFKDDSRIFEKPENLDEEERRKRAENLDSVQRKASESLCLYYRFFKDDPLTEGMAPASCSWAWIRSRRS